ncbi:MAG: ABC transporter substrate-binding protein [Bacteroidota bacterium]
MKDLFLFIILSVLFSSCSVSEKQENRITDNEYAEKFHIQKHKGFKIIRIYDPWQRSGGEELIYILARDAEKLPDSLRNFPLIPIPVSNVVVFSTTHIGFIHALEETEGISGVSGLKYVCDDLVNQRKKEKKVFDVGFPPSVDYERLIALSPDVVFLYGIESSVTGISARLRQAGIPVFMIAEYLEPHPLGKLEWIRVFGQFYDKEEQAEFVFEKSKNEYERMRMTVDKNREKPSVLVGLPWKNTWHLAGGESYTAKLIRDAGGNYLWSENMSMENIPLSLEAVLTRAMRADVWINSGGASSLREITGIDHRFTLLKVFQDGEVYNNDAMKCIGGGNPYWEKGVVEPHLILKDLIKIFYPDILPEHDFAYYRKLE